MALTGEGALRAAVGETVRLFVGNGGPNLISSFHVIGEIFDRVHHEAGSAINENVQTTLLPAGGAAIVELETQVPGDYILVDHSIFRAFNKGALGILEVSGDPDPVVYSGRVDEGIYIPEGGAIQILPQAEEVGTVPGAASMEERLASGGRIYTQNCAACHQAEGQGIAGAFPPLAASDFLNDDPGRAIAAVLDGLQGPITVNGAPYDGVMPAVRLSDQELADVLTYVYSQWGNSGIVVTPSQVAAARE